MNNREIFVVIRKLEHYMGVLTPPLAKHQPAELAWHQIAQDCKV